MQFELPVRKQIIAFFALLCLIMYVLFRNGPAGERQPVT